MMKRTVSFFTVLSLFFAPLLRADSCCEEEFFNSTEEPVLIEEPAFCEKIEEPIFCEEEERCFPGKMVQRPTENRLSECKKRKLRSWGLAIGVVAIGIATLILVGQHHKK